MKYILYRFLAAMIFFTRLPFWRIANVPKEFYERLVPLWPFAGWLTGSVMAVTFLLANMFLPVTVSVILALTSRLLITGALHEDGYADFCDGFGGGTSRARILEIMKDSHIGSYGVIGLIVYYALFISSLSSLPTAYTPSVLLIGDIFSKWISSNIINVLPYARKESEAKNKLVYQRMTLADVTMSIIFCLIPLGILYSFRLLPTNFFIPMLLSVIVASIMFLIMHKKIQGYTGDCCGATVTVTELIFCIGMLIAIRV